MSERDTRPLSEICFARDLPTDRENAERRVRDLLEDAGVTIAQDIVDLGCTGLFEEFQDFDDCKLGRGDACAIDLARYVRGHMAGSICGLPCYVPRTRYCLIHDTIGGLQEAGNKDGPQVIKHPDAILLMSRELTEDERRKVLGVEAKLAADAKQQALAEYGAEEVELLEQFGVATARAADRDAIQDELDVRGASCPIPPAPFVCPDHGKLEPDWSCRRCVAQAIVEGKSLEVRVYANQYLVGLREKKSLEGSLMDLQRGEVESVELWVRAAAWSKKVTRD